MNEQVTSALGNAHALCLGIMASEQAPPPGPTAPLIRAEVTVRLETAPDPALQHEATPPNVLEWFNWEELPLFPAAPALLICRDREPLVPVQEESGTSSARLELLFSVHPVGSEPAQESVFRQAAEQAIRMGLHSRFRLAAAARLTISNIRLEFDPGTTRSIDTYIGSTMRGAPKITLAKSNDWRVKTCYLTGAHYFPPAPLAFFYEDDPSKPVCPLAAMKCGFTIAPEFLRALSARLNSADNLIALPGEIWHANNRDDDPYLPSELEETIDQWGGAVNQGFRTHPAIEPQNIPAAIVRATGDRMGMAREFLRNPSAHPRQPEG
jgi:hypothetical protein